MVLMKRCGCVSLRTGCFIIGSLDLSACIFNLINLFGFPDQILDNLPESEDIKREQIEKAIYAVQITMFCILAFAIAIILMLLYGTYKKNKCFVLPWLIASVTIQALGAILIVALIIGAFTFLPGIFGAVLTGLYILSLAYFIICFLCVLSFYQELSLKDRMRSRNQQKEEGLSPLANDGKPPAYKEY